MRAPAKAPSPFCVCRVAEDDIERCCLHRIDASSSLAPLPFNFLRVRNHSLFLSFSACCCRHFTFLGRHFLLPLVFFFSCSFQRRFRPGNWTRALNPSCTEVREQPSLLIGCCGEIRAPSISPPKLREKHTKAAKVAIFPGFDKKK